MNYTLSFARWSYLSFIKKRLSVRRGLFTLWGWYSLSFILLMDWLNLMRKVATRELVKCCLISWGNESWLSSFLRWCQTQTCETLGKAAASFPLDVGTSEVRNHLIHPYRSTPIPRRVAWQWWDRYTGLPFLLYMWLSVSTGQSIQQLSLKTDQQLWSEV